MIRFIRSSFWPGLAFDSLAELNQQAQAWCDEINRRVHGTAREVPQERFAREGLTPLNGQPAYDTSYVSHRQVAKDCLFSYRGNRYSVPHVYAGKSVLVRQPLDGSLVRIFHQQDLIAEHALAEGKGGMILEPSDYGNLPRRSRVPASPAATVFAELTPGPDVGLHYTIPEVELRPRSIYNSCCEEVAHVPSV